MNGIEIDIDIQFTANSYGNKKKKNILRLTSFSYSYVLFFAWKYSNEYFKMSIE